MRIGLVWRVLPAYLAIALLIVVPLWQHQQDTDKVAAVARAAQSTVAAAPQTPTLIQGAPVRIVLPNQAIDLPVVVGTYDTKANVWSVAGNAANYAPNTSLNNNEHDSTFIYGHATTQIFGSTSSLRRGDAVYVYTDNHHIFKYVYTGKEVVKPTDVQVFNELSGKPGLVLMTCDGAWSQNRRLMFFSFEAVA